MFDDPHWLPLFRLALRTLDLPRRYLPEVPWLSEFVALPDSQLEIGQDLCPVCHILRSVMLGGRRSIW